MLIHIYPVYDIRRAKMSKPCLSDIRTIKGVNVMSSIKNIRNPLAEVPRARPVLALRNA
jgi:hypothetical protein